MPSRDRGFRLASAAVFVILAIPVLAAHAGTSGSPPIAGGAVPDSSGDSPTVLADTTDDVDPRPTFLQGRPSVRVSQNCYFPGEVVGITLKNVGGGLLVFTSIPDYEVVSDVLGTVRMILFGFQVGDVVMGPGESMEFRWNQLWFAKDENGDFIHLFEPVPEGEYRAVVKVAEEQDVVVTLGEASFIIGACDVQVSAGDDVFVDEGQPFSLSPSLNETGTANLTSISWDLDPSVDGNGDGNPRNDADLVGETPTLVLGDDGIYPVTLNVRGFLPNATRQAAQDVVFAIDSSGSMQWNDPQDLRKDAAQRYVDFLVPDDRAAVVDFDEFALLVQDEHLSSNYDRVKANIDLVDSDGGTYIAPGLALSLDELQHWGHPNHHWVVILLTDAESIFEDDDILIPLQTLRAKSLGVRVFPVGLNVPPRLDPVMQRIADETGGQYFSTPSPDALADIYDAVLQAVRGRRGSFFVASDTLTVTVRNVAPNAAASADVTAAGTVNVTLRVAGEKWHDVVLTLYRDGNAIGNASILRVPGSPDDQSATVWNATLFEGSASVARIVYTPMDDAVNGQPNGADPAWVIVALPNGTEVRFHHTFNAGHTNTWVWDVDLTGQISGSAAKATLVINVSDPGSDDILITVDWGDGATETRVHFADGIGADPFPSPSGFPASVTDSAVHEYRATGTYTVTLTIADDDGGSIVVALVIVID